MIKFISERIKSISLYSIEMKYLLIRQNRFLSRDLTVHFFYDAPKIIRLNMSTFADNSFKFEIKYILVFEKNILHKKFSKEFYTIIRKFIHIKGFQNSFLQEWVLHCFPVTLKAKCIFMLLGLQVLKT